jgi:hypothetical protein
MNTQDLKLFTLCYVFEHDNLMLEEKEILGEFIVDADAHQVMHLLNSGEATDYIPEEGNEIVEYYYNNVVAPILTEVDVAAGLKAGVKAGATVGKAISKHGGKVGKEVMKMSTTLAKKLHGVKSLGPIDFYMPGGKVSATAGGIAAASIAAVVGMAAYAAVKVYKSKLSSAARACKGKKGDEKKVCMAKAKVSAYQAQIQALASKKNVCSKAKDTAKCKARIDKKVANMKAKLAKVK